MGCDIHIYTEKKVNGEWINIDPLEFEYMSEDFIKRDICETYDGRNYELFGFLAQVRTEQKNGFKSKGFPNDASKEVKENHIQWDCDAHSASYLTLKELETNLNKTVFKTGLFSKEQKIRLDKSIERGFPDWDNLYPCCGGSTDKSLVRFEYDIPMSYIFKEFVETTIAHLKKYAWESKIGKNDDNSVRVVFWFDN